MTENARAVPRDEEIFFIEEKLMQIADIFESGRLSGSGVVVAKALSHGIIVIKFEQNSRTVIVGNGETDPAENYYNVDDFLHFARASGEITVDECADFVERRQQLSKEIKAAGPIAKAVDKLLSIATEETGEINSITQFAYRVEGFLSTNKNTHYEVEILPRSSEQEYTVVCIVDEATGEVLLTFHDPEDSSQIESTSIENSISYTKFLTATGSLNTEEIKLFLDAFDESDHVDSLEDVSHLVAHLAKKYRFKYKQNKVGVKINYEDSNGNPQHYTIINTTIAKKLKPLGQKYRHWGDMRSIADLEILFEFLEIPEKIKLPKAGL